jgi:hypothetical protein
MVRLRISEPAPEPSATPPTPNRAVTPPRLERNPTILRQRFQP